MKHTVNVSVELRDAVHALMLPILSNPQTAPTIPEEFERKIANLVEFIALARTYVERDGHSREANGVPITEGNTRLPQQLCQIARGSALIDGRSKVNDMDYKLVCRVAFDSLPPARISVLKVIIDRRSPHSLGLPKANSLSFDRPTSTIQCIVGTIVASVGGRPISLAPGQTAFVVSTPPTTTATPSPSPNANHWNNTNVVVTLNSTDIAGGPGVKDITYSLSGAQTGSGVVAGNIALVPISAEGITTVSFFATDNAGNQEAAKSLTVRIDKTPPTLLCSASPAILWPPDNHLVPVTISVTVNDALSGPGSFTLASVTSNEKPPDNDVSHDIKGFIVATASTHGLLRAERLHGDRVYTFVYTGTDLAGNQGSSTVTVIVPHHHDDGHE